MILFRRTQRSVINESAAQRADWRHDIGALFVLASSLSALALTSADPPIATSLVLGIWGGTTAVQTVIDVTTRRLPILISVSASGLMLLVAIPLTRSGTQLLAMLAGATVMMLIAQVLVTVSGGSLGRGDVYFCLPLGLALGIGSTLSTTMIISMYAWTISALAGGLTAGAGLLLRRVSKQSTIPYGPFLVVGTIVTLAIRGTP
ncbi:MAG: hypothetical protein ACO3SZ_08510 [Ilumatobacteraceae bacterium]